MIGFPSDYDDDDNHDNHDDDDDDEKQEGRFFLERSMRFIQAVLEPTII